MYWKGKGGWLFIFIVKKLILYHVWYNSCLFLFKIINHEKIILIPII